MLKMVKRKALVKVVTKKRSSIGATICTSTVDRPKSMLESASMLSSSVNGQEQTVEENKTKEATKKTVRRLKKQTKPGTLPPPETPPPQQAEKRLSAIVATANISDTFSPPKPMKSAALKPKAKPSKKKQIESGDDDNRVARKPTNKKLLASKKLDDENGDETEPGKIENGDEQMMVDPVVDRKKKGKAGRKRQIID